VCGTCLAPPAPLTAEYECVTCGRPFLTGHPLDANGRCRLCRAGHYGFDAAFAFGSYEGRLRDLVHLFKYGGVETLAGPLGRIMMLAYPRGRTFDVVVPMPMHWWRRWRRGFNQSELLAREVGERAGLPVAAAVRRLRHTPPQAGLSGKERRKNVEGAFAIRRPDRVRGKRVLLVDDVLTTGSTASACARALKEAGARYVAVLALARADRRHASDAADQGDRELTLSLGATACA